MIDENGYEMDLSLCTWGPWEKMTDVEVDCWMCKCTTCNNYQTSTVDPDIPVELYTTNVEAPETAAEAPESAPSMDPRLLQK